MDIISYIKWNNYSLLNQENSFNFCRYNNDSYISEIIDYCKIYSNYYNIYLDEYYEYKVHRIFDIMDKIIILIKKKDNKFNDIEDILNISLIVDGYINFNLIIKEYNITYHDKELIIINFNLSNFVKYQDKNIGGLPLFLFDILDTKIEIHLKNKLDYDDLIHVHIGGFMIFPSQ